jgi:1-acyl-sn-glycerol-3-phosphate acyltransferase
MVYFYVLVVPFVIIASSETVSGGNFVYKLLKLWADAWFPIAGLRTKNIYEEKHDKKKQYVFVSNHISFLDAAFIIDVIRQPFRPLGKIEIQKVPVFGIIYRVVVVVVDRSSSENRAKSIRELKDFIKKGISILIFPEGTFNETTKLKDCYEVLQASREHKPQTNNLLIPLTVRYDDLKLNHPYQTRLLKRISWQRALPQRCSPLKQRFNVDETKFASIMPSWIQEEAPIGIGLAFVNSHANMYASIILPWPCQKHIPGAAPAWREAVRPGMRK